MDKFLDENYLRLKQFAIEFSENYMDQSLYKDVPMPSENIREFEEMVREGTVSFSEVLRGLKAGCFTYLKLSEKFSDAKVSVIDEHMKRKGAITLSELRALKSSRLKSILKNGEVVDEEDAQFVESVLKFSDYLMPKKDVASLNEILDCYYEKSTD